MLSRTKFEIEPLVEEILDQLPAEVWSSATTTFLDPAMGGGQFVRAIERRLREAGHSNENIFGRVHGCESTVLHVNYAVNKHNLVGNYGVCDFLEKDFGDMKFDVVVGNPPYQGKAELHQKFFNKGVELLNDGGIITFIQPATPYFNKKESIRANAKLMIDNVKRYVSDVKIISGKIFEAAGIFTSLAITTLTKKNNPGTTLNKYQSESGNIYKNISIDSINMIQMNPAVFETLSAKILSFANNSSIQNIITTNPSDKKLYVQKVRGHIGDRDFYTFLSKDKSYWKMDTTSDYGLKVNSKKQLDSMISYLTSNVARFCLAIYKFNGNNHMGEFKSVPIVPLDKEWTDEELCKYFGITDIEYAEIYRCIPKYYDK